jgi:lipoic acid synthetase
VGENYHSLKQLARSLQLNTVCESAHCPNIGECWHHKTATFMMLGNLCTRRCGFCAVPKGRPEPIDFDEPRRVAQAVSALGLEYAVITSVNRDDDLLGGARAFALVIEEIRRQAPGCRIEVLIPDFQGNQEAIRAVVEAHPEVLNHNTESVPRLYRVVRSGARYERTLELLRYSKELRPEGLTKSGVMVGLGEETAELLQVFRDLAAVHCDILTIGQYLRPSRDHLPMARLYTPREFAELKRSKWASATSNPARWSAPATTRTSKPHQLGCLSQPRFANIVCWMERGRTLWQSQSWPVFRRSRKLTPTSGVAWTAQ